MKKLIAILSIGLFAGCNSENAPDCLKSAGNLTTKSIAIDEFSNLIINNEFNVIITEGPQQAIKVTIGENLIEEIKFDLVNGTLVVSDFISCRWVRSYNYPILEITHPNLSSIEIVGGSIVTSANTLTYPTLTLISKDSNGDFNLNINNNILNIDGNEITNYKLTGQTNLMNFTFSSGDSRFEGVDFQIIDAIVNHNGTNEVIVNVSRKLTARLGSTGDVIYVGQVPQTIEVEENNRGKLINGVN